MRGVGEGVSERCTFLTLVRSSNYLFRFNHLKFYPHPRVLRKQVNFFYGLGLGRRKVGPSLYHRFQLEERLKFVGFVIGLLQNDDWHDRIFSG